jgi:hypothetical protein
MCQKTGLFANGNEITCTGMFVTTKLLVLMSGVERVNCASIGRVENRIARKMVGLKTPHWVAKARDDIKECELHWQN